VIAEYIMSRCNWDAVWFRGTYGPGATPWWTGPGRDPWERPWWSLHFLTVNRRGEGHVCVGVWAGPDGDLLCVRDCDTLEDAGEWLAPSGRTILHAALKSLWLRWTGPRVTVKGSSRVIRSPGVSSAAACDIPSTGSRNSPNSFSRQPKLGVDDSLPNRRDAFDRD